MWSHEVMVLYAEWCHCDVVLGDIIYHVWKEEVNMNRIEVYVKNITEHTIRSVDGITIHRLVCDTNSYGTREYGRLVVLTQDEWEMVEKKGYYLG